MLRRLFEHEEPVTWVRLHDFQLQSLKVIG